MAVLSPFMFFTRLCLPRHDPVNQSPLFLAGFCKVDAGCLDAFMSQKIGQERNIIEPFQKIDGVAVPERMRVHCCRIDAVALCDVF